MSVTVLAGRVISNIVRGIAHTVEKSPPNSVVNSFGRAGFSVVFVGVGLAAMPRRALNLASRAFGLANNFRQ